MRFGFPTVDSDDGLDLGHVGRPHVTFSWKEILHLAVAIVALTIAFAFFADEPGYLPSGMALLGSAIAVATGFGLHELAHKLVAQRYGHWAEFRAQFLWLGGTILLALLPQPILIAAPGAVMIQGHQGHVPRRENGIISLVGPGVNFVIAWIAFPLTIAVDQQQPVPRIAGTVAFVNSLLCVFNLLPFGPLDGRKVWRWSPLILVGAMACAIATFGVMWLTTGK